MRYPVSIVWTGNRGSGTSDYRAYGREHEIRIGGKTPIAGSSDPAFRGDPTCHNPEELLVAAVSACHMLWFLHLAADAGLVVTAYEDAAEGRMELHADGGGRFTEIRLRPDVRLADPTRAVELPALHATAHARCFIANSLNFPVTITPPTTHHPPS